MVQSPPSAVELPFSEKYDKQHAQHYQLKHQDGLARKLSNWRDIQVARKALNFADQPGIVLDLPCGAGRFWPMLSEKKNRVIIAADNSSDMLNVAREANGVEISDKIKSFQTSAFAIDLPDCAVDSIFCMRLLHHVGEERDRSKMLQEFHRVSRDTVIVSLWVDGNYKAWRRQKLEAKRERRQRHGYQNRFVIEKRQIEGEFKAAGFKVVSHIDFLPLFQMWRTYVLRKH